MPFHDTIQDYRRAAQFRLQDARELQMPPTHGAERSDANRRHLRGAMYLAGYAVECLLKAYIIQQTGAQTLSQAMERINKQRSRKKAIQNIARTAAGHQIGYMILLTDLGKSYPDYDARLWSRVGKWQSSWRYETDYPEDTAEFLEDVTAVVKWLQPKIKG